MLELDTIGKESVDKNTAQLKFEADDNKEYKIEGIQNSAIYAMKLETSYLPKLYYLVNSKG